MTKPKPKSGKTVYEPFVPEYEHLLGGVDLSISTARSFVARAANAVMTAIYWDAGRQIVEFEQSGKGGAAHGPRCWSNSRLISPRNMAVDSAWITSRTSAPNLRAHADLH